MRWLTLLLSLLLPLPAAALTLDGATSWQGEQHFAETVRVPAGAVLTVAPSAIIHFAIGSLEISGQLQAQGARFTGNHWQGIVLKGTGADTALTDCTIDGADTGLEIIGGAPQLKNLYLHDNRIGLLLGKKTAAVVTGCRIEKNTRAGLIIKDEAQPRVEDNSIAGNGLFGAYIVHAKPQSFTGNQISGQPTGLKISNFGSDPQVTGNRFKNNEVAILVDKAARPTLTGNLLTGNGTALHLYRRADPQVSGNRFSGNQLGILVAFSSYPRIEGNDFANNGLALKLEFQSSSWEEQNGETARQAETSRGVFGQTPKQNLSEESRRPAQNDGTVDARGNWWGPAGTGELTRTKERTNPSFIHDGRDQPTFIEGGNEYPLDRVIFAPWSPTALTGETIR
jgi:parallel beta-helix repeat protein